MPNACGLHLLTFRQVYQVADAVFYLHEYPKIVHGDIKGVSTGHLVVPASDRMLCYCAQCNVLIAEDGRALLTDFGLSMILEEMEGISSIPSSLKEGGRQVLW